MKANETYKDPFSFGIQNLAADPTPTPTSTSGASSTKTLSSPDGVFTVSWTIR